MTPVDLLQQYVRCQQPIENLNLNLTHRGGRRVGFGVIPSNATAKGRGRVEPWEKKLVKPTTRVRMNEVDARGDFGYSARGSSSRASGGGSSSNCRVARHIEQAHGMVVVRDSHGRAIAPGRARALEMLKMNGGWDREVPACAMVDLAHRKMRDSKLSRMKRRRR
jgi:hypothetical protein